MPWEGTREILLTCADCSVPIWIERLRPLTDAQRHERAQLCAQVVAEKSDVLQFGGGKKGEAAEAYNRLMEGIALCAFAAGGVKWEGRHWEANPAESAPIPPAPPPSRVQRQAPPPPPPLPLSMRK